VCDGGWLVWWRWMMDGEGCLGLQGQLAGGVGSRDNLLDMGILGTALGFRDSLLEVAVLGTAC
jgi:hypothetical protein